MQFAYCDDLLSELQCSVCLPILSGQVEIQVEGVVRFHDWRILHIRLRPHYKTEIAERAERSVLVIAGQYSCNSCLAGAARDEIKIAGGVETRIGSEIERAGEEIRTSCDRPKWT